MKLKSFIIKLLNEVGFMLPEASFLNFINSWKLTFLSLLPSLTLSFLVGPKAFICSHKIEENNNPHVRTTLIKHVYFFM